MTPCLDAALSYRERGWSVLPLVPNGKKPAMNTWKRCQTKPLSEPEVRARFRNHTNVGVVMGTVSGLVGLDIDSQEGVKLLAQWSRGITAKSLPATPTFTTPGGGCRLLYRLPPGIQLPARAFSDTQKKEALRILGEGTQTAMPPSVIEGKPYAWVAGLGPDEVEVAPCPAWLIARLKGEDQKEDPGEDQGCGLMDARERARRYLAKTEVCDPRPTHPMDASTHLLKAATALVVGFALPDDQAVALLQEWDAPNPCGPYPVHELRRKCEQARRHCNKPPGYLLSGSAPISMPLPEKKPRIQTLAACDLMAQEFPPMRWAIPNILPEGGVLFAGRPKGGKSWLMLQLAICIAQGEPALKRIPVEQGDVLYISLEDGPRRLRGRLIAMLGEDPHAAPPQLHVATEWPRISQGCMDALADWVDNHPQARLIIFDTLTRIRDRGKRSGNSESNSLYEDDYDLIAALKKLGDEKHVCVCAVHHTRKPKEQEEDPFDQISGTLGLGGAADAIVVLKRAVGASDAKLHVTGRDVEEQSLNLAWNSEDCLWGMLEGEALTPDQANVVQALTFAGKPLTPLEVYPLIGKNHEATRKLLYRMASDGLIIRDRGKYSVLPAQGSIDVPHVPLDENPFEEIV